MLAAADGYAHAATRAHQARLTLWVLLKRSWAVFTLMLSCALSVAPLLLTAFLPVMAIFCPALTHTAVMLSVLPWLSVLSAVSHFVVVLLPS